MPGALRAVLFALGLALPPLVMEPAAAGELPEGDVETGKQVAAGPLASGLPDLSVIAQIPDLVQTDPKGGFARGGKSFCGPVAVSNSLVWLKAGSREPFTDREAQYGVVRQLASPDYMKVDAVKGVGPHGVVRGVRRFVEKDIGDDDFSLAYQGWRSAPRDADTGIDTPELSWLCSFVGPGKAAWINLGWYRHDEKENTYERIGGHWVTLVGHGADERKNRNGRIIVIHDPAPRSGREPDDYVLLTALERGTLIGKDSRLPRPAKGLFLMGGGLHVKSTADVAILDGVVGLDLDPDQAD